MMTPPAFRTRRLIAEGWESVPDLTELRGLLTPAVLRDLPPSFATDGSEASLRRWIDARRAESRVSDIRRRDDGACLGLLILAPDPRAPALHLGYLLATEVWGQGYASELVTGLVEALRPLAPVTLKGGVARDNPASARVLEKAGFQRDRSETAADTIRYSLTLGRA